MTEKQWEACRDPDELLDYHSMKRDPRRLRLLAAACARRLWLAVGEHLRGPAFQQLIDVVERYADGTADRTEFVAARKPFRRAARELAAVRSGAVQTAVSVLDCLSHDAMEGMTAAINNAREVHRARAREGAAQCDLIRCVFSNPERPPVVIDPASLAFNDGAVVKLARVIDNERELPSGNLDVARLAILADALEEAGCAEPAALAHLRGPGPHVRGCHTVDAIVRRS